jgi:hypothetical protein
MVSQWQGSIYWRAFEEARHALRIAETREGAMIVIVIAIAGIAVIWLTAGQDIATHELLVRSASFVALVCFSLPVIYVWKLFTIPAKSFQIILGKGNPYETVEPSGVNRTRIVRAKLQNNINTEISNGKLHLLNLEPPNNGYKDFLLKGHITIGPHNNTVIDIAAYNEGTSETMAGAWIQLIIPNHGGYFMPATFGNLPIRSHTFHLKFSYLGNVLDQIYCRTFVDSDHHLQLEEWS